MKEEYVITFKSIVVDAEDEEEAKKKHSKRFNLVILRLMK